MYIEPSLEADQVVRDVIGAAIAVHRALGPGFLESIYERALSIELAHRGISFVQQSLCDVRYRGEIVGEHRVDFIVDRRVIVELKAANAIDPRHVVQVLSYLRATNIDLGLIINFNVRLLRDGIKRVVFSPYEGDTSL